VFLNESLAKIENYLNLTIMLSLSEIIAFLKLKKTELFDNYNLEKLGVFGSYAQGVATSNSDIDIIVEFQEGTDDLHEKKEELRKLFSNQFQKEIDICREKYIKPYFKQSILNSAIYV